MKLFNGMDSDVLRNIEDFVLGGHMPSKMEYLSSGINGDVFAYEGVAVKKFVDGAREDGDAVILNDLNKSVFYPKVFGFEEGKYMVTELIDGATIYSIDGKNNELIREYKKEIEQAKKDALFAGYYTDDVHLNNMMLTKNGEFKIIDVGRFGKIPTLQMGILDFLFGSSSHRRQHGHSSSSRRHHHRRDHNRRHHHHHSISSVSSIFSSISFSGSYSS